MGTERAADEATGLDATEALRAFVAAAQDGRWPPLPWCVAHAPDGDVPAAVARLWAQCRDPHAMLELAKLAGMYEPMGRVAVSAARVALSAAARPDPRLPRALDVAEAWLGFRADVHALRDAIVDVERAQSAGYDAVSRCAGRSVAAAMSAVEHADAAPRSQASRAAGCFLAVSNAVDAHVNAVAEVGWARRALHEAAARANDAMEVWQSRREDTALRARFEEARSAAEEARVWYESLMRRAVGLVSARLADLVRDFVAVPHVTPP